MRAACLLLVYHRFESSLLMRTKQHYRAERVLSTQSTRALPGRICLGMLSLPYMHSISRYAVHTLVQLQHIIEVMFKYGVTHECSMNQLIAII